MKLCFISNFLNHHQLPLCNSFYSILGDDFKFIACEPIPQERLNMGYQKDFDVPYLIDGTDSNTVYKYLDEYDVFIVGSCPSEYVNYGFDHNKMVCRYSERIIRDGYWRVFSPLGQWNMHHLFPKKKMKNAYLLCSSAYSALDHVLYGAFKNQAYKWGYFPAMSDKTFDELQALKQPNSIIWAGRFLKLKQADQVIEVARMLKEDGLDFTITMIGNGEELPNIKDMINRYNLNDHITMVDYLPFQEVRDYMERHEIGLFTSNFREGWGAVLNEFMSSACAPVTNYKAGASIFLVDNENGIIYDDTVEMLYKYTKKLLTDKAYLKKTQLNAYNTITTLWNNEVAAERFVEWAQSVLVGNPISYEDGPISKAIEISNGSAKDYIHK